jgi:hypothetical protein
MTPCSFCFSSAGSRISQLLQQAAEYFLLISNSKEFNLKSQDQAHHRQKGRAVKKRKNSTKSVRSRKTEWSEQPDVSSADFDRLRISESEEEINNGIIFDE